MPGQLLLLFLLLFSLFIISQKIQSYIYKCIFLITNNKRLAIDILLLVVLPGTVIHELSHFLLATILRVPTGELSIIPTVEETGEIKAGKLTLGKTDPFRLSLIGLAPLIIGVILIYLAGKIFFSSFPQLLIANYQLFIGLYLLFATSLTMFSSKKDLESLIIAGPIAIIVIISFYLIGVRMFFAEPVVGKIKNILSDVNFYLLITAVIDYLVFLILSANLFLWQKILKRKIK